MLLGCFLRFTVVPQVVSGAGPVAGKALLCSIGQRRVFFGRIQFATRVKIKYSERLRFKKSGIDAVYARRAFQLIFCPSS